MAPTSFMNRLTGWMQGRNGADALSMTALGASFVLLLLQALTGQRWLSVLALACAVYSCWRVSSRQVRQRQQENRAFLVAVAPVASWVRNPAASLSELRAYKHLSCPSCHQRVRVPRGKGHLRVTCPSCHTKFEARS